MSDDRRDAGEANPVVVFGLGLVATLGTILGLGALGGGAEIVRRNALHELRWAGVMVLVAMLLAGFAAIWSSAATVLLFISLVVGVFGLGVAGYAVTKRSPGRPAISVTLNAGPPPTAIIVVKAGGLKSDDDLNLLATAFRSPFGQGSGQQRLIRESFGPDPSGDASLQVQVLLPSNDAFKSVVVRAWVGDVNDPGRCLLEKKDPSRIQKTLKTGCVIFPLAVVHAAASVAAQPPPRASP